MSATKKDLLAQADKIKKQIDGGKITGKKKLQSAKYKMYNLRYRAGQIDKKSKAASEPVVKKQARLKKAKASNLANPDQGILPGFLEQMNMVRIEELIADKIFNAIKTGEMSLKPSDIKSMTAEAIESVPVFPSKKKKAG